MLTSNYKWVEEIDYKEHLDEDGSLIVSEFGIDTYLKLLNVMGNSRIYLSSKPLTKMKKAFIRNNLDKYSIREFQRILDVSEDFVRNTIKELEK